jgi:hypothetical protein
VSANGALTPGRSRVEVLGIVTHDRSASLITCLESYLEHFRQHRRTPEIVVMNDGSDVQAALRAVSASTNRPIRYAGAAEKQRFAAALAGESRVPRHLVDFALFGDPRVTPRIGANRNCLLLDTVGSLLLAVDDDTVGRVAEAPAGESLVEFSSEYEPREFWFFRDRAAAAVAAPPANADLLAAHEGFLGAAITAPGQPEQRVVMTVPGLVGDSGMGVTRWFLTLDGPSRERLVASPDAYASALRSREVLRTVRRPTIAATTFCMTTFLGLDNERGLPPFFPVARNSDGVYGVTIRRAMSSSRVAFLPSVLLHAPPEARRFRGDEAWTEPARVRMADVLIASILAHGAGDGNAGADDARRWQQLGRFLRELASLAIGEFAAFVASAQQLRDLTLTTLLETRLAQYGRRPEFWAGDVRRTIDLLRSAPASPDYIVPRDLGAAFDSTAARELSRELVGRFGDLLEAWPALIEAAGALRARGSRLSQPV